MIDEHVRTASAIKETRNYPPVLTHPFVAQRSQPQPVKLTMQLTTFFFSVCVLAAVVVPAIPAPWALTSLTVCGDTCPHECDSKSKIWSCPYGLSSSTSYVTC